MQSGKNMSLCLRPRRLCLAFLLFCLLGQVAESKPCDTPCPASCPEKPVCAPGVPVVLDSCSCCLVCARQRGENCSDLHPCQEGKDLFCDRSANPRDRNGICMKVEENNCVYDGIRYQSGATFQPNCQSQCHCQDGQVACVPLCREEVKKPSSDCPLPRKVKVPGECCEKWVCENSDALQDNRTLAAVEGNNCVFAGITYKSGDTFQPNCRFQCTCQNGRVACVPRCREEMIIPSSDCPFPKKVNVPGECCEKWVCEKKDASQDIRTLAAVEGNNCDFAGITYKSGDTFQPNCRFQCTCQNGRVACVPRCREEMIIPSSDCPFPKKVNVPGECCEKWVCEKKDALQDIRTLAAVEGNNCVFAGITYKSGDTFEPNCRFQCTCQNGRVACVPRCRVEMIIPSSDCPFPKKVNVPGECCEKWVCEKSDASQDNRTLAAVEGNNCDFAGITYKSGDTFQPNCRFQCTCQNGRVACVPRCREEMIIPSSDCPFPKKVKVPGECCEKWVCEKSDASQDIRTLAAVEGNNCVFAGITYKSGDTFQPNCRFQCTCQNGHVACVPRCREEMIIPSSDCPFPKKVNVPGECCEKWVCEKSDASQDIRTLAAVEGNNCVFAGITYKSGDTFQPNCRIQCTCQNGHVACVPLCREEMIIPSSDCPFPKKVNVPGECCEKWVCEKSDASQDIRTHAAVEGNNCVFAGITYKSGDTFQPNCRIQCTCQNGHVACVPLCREEMIIPSSDCPFPKKVNVPGECCEKWVCEKSDASQDIRTHAAVEGNNCVFAGITYKSGDTFEPNCRFHCTCQNGHVACVPRCREEMIIPSSDCPFPKKVKVPGECCEKWVCEKSDASQDIRTHAAVEGNNCVFAGITYKSGDTFEPNCRFHCTCQNGHVACVPRCREEMIIPSSDCPFPKKVKVPGECCEKWVCEKSDASQDIRTHAAVEEHNCVFAGITYQSGDTFQPNCRFQCTCQDGRVACVPVCMEEMMPSSDCPFPRKVKVPGECCEKWVCETHYSLPDTHTLPVFRSEDSVKISISKPNNCIEQITQWTACSRTCGFGISTRISNDNEHCVMQKEVRHCIVRPCGLQIKRPKDSTEDICHPLVKSPKAMHLEIDNCTSVESYRPKFCGKCIDGRCCNPEVTRTISMGFQCSNGILVEKLVMLIRECECDSNCPEDNPFIQNLNLNVQWGV